MVFNEPNYSTSHESSNWNSYEQHKVLVSVEIVLFTIRDGTFEVLLLKRDTPPFLDFWELPGGLLRMDIGQRGESTDDAALRELNKAIGQTGATLRHLEQLGTYGDPNRDPREERTISIAYMGTGPNLADHQESGGASFLPVRYVREELSDKIAFDHRGILKNAISKLKTEIEHSTLATSFCSPAFTMSELRNVYETILERKLDPGNFQKKALSTNGLLKEVDGMNREAATRGRPAKLYNAGPASNYI